MDEIKVETNSKSKITAIAVEIILAVILILFYILYSKGNRYVVSNTIDGLPILFTSMFVSIMCGFLFAYIIDKTRLSNIKYANLQEFIGLWALLAPIFLFGYIGFSLNFKMSEGKLENIETVVENKTGDLIMQSYYLETKIGEKLKKVRVSKTDWKEKAIGDTVKFSIIKGFFGYDVLRYELETNE